MLMRSQRRHRARLVEGLDLEDSEASADSSARATIARGASTHECETVLRDALAELPEDYRHIVVAHYHEDRPAGDRRQAPRDRERGTSRLHRARSRLREILENSAAPVERRQVGEAA